MRDYRVDIVSNFGLESFCESTAISNLTKSQAERIADILNEDADERDFHSHRPRHMGERLWRGMEEFV